MAKKNTFYPDWYHKAPPPQSYRSIFKWGYPDCFKHPNRRLYALMKEAFGMTDEDFKVKQNVGEERVEYDIPSRLSPKQLDELRAMVGPENVHTDDYNRLRVAYGKMIYDLIRLREKKIENLPDAVVSPGTRKTCATWCAGAGKTRCPLRPLAAVLR